MLIISVLEQNFPGPYASGISARAESKSFLYVCQDAGATLRAQADFPGFNQTWILCLIDNTTSLFIQVFLIY